MRVLNDFVGIDLTEDQLLPIARDLLPRLLTIVGMAEVCRLFSHSFDFLIIVPTRPTLHQLELVLSSSSDNAS